MWIRFEIYKVNQIQSWISLEMSGPPPLCTHDRKGERVTKFSLESVWKSQGLLLSAHLTGRVSGNQIQSWISLEMSGHPPLCTPDRKGERQPNSFLNQSGNVRASSSLHTWQEGWEGNQIQSWISLEMSGHPPLCTPDRKGERQPNSLLNQSGNVRASSSLP